MRINRERLEALPPRERKEMEGLLRQMAELREEDPLQFFRPHSEPQRRFMESRSPITAAFAGNQFGKSVALTVKALCQHVPTDGLPEHMRGYKLAGKFSPVVGWFLCPSFKALETFVLPTFREWAPKAYLLGGRWDRAWDKTNRVLRFKDGGEIHVFTYEMEASKLVGARVDYVAYDEPPPEQHRGEALMRLVARGGFEMFAMTPVNISGGGIGWVYRELWKRRGDRDKTVITASIHDNPTLDKETVARVLSNYADEERRAREFGEFVHIGGMVYQGGFERVLCDPPSRDHVRKWDVVVGIDPGLKNAAFVWVGFDQDNVAYVFDELLLNERTPRDYVDGIREVNGKWGLREDPLYIIDPSARNRSLINRESVEGELQRLGLYAMPGQNQVEAGVQQARLRIQQKGLYVSTGCVGLRGEADEYRMEERPDGEFRVVKENDHRLDALRYCLMSRVWSYGRPLADETHRRGYVHGVEPPYRELVFQEADSPPLGAMS